MSLHNRNVLVCPHLKCPSIEDPDPGVPQPEAAGSLVPEDSFGRTCSYEREGSPQAPRVGPDC